MAVTTSIALLSLVSLIPLRLASALYVVAIWASRCVNAGCMYVIPIPVRQSSVTCGAVPGTVSAKASDIQ